MPEGYHPPLEEYLETIHDLEEEGIPVIQARIVERLGHSAPTVSETVRRLRDEGYVEIDGRSIALTGRGRIQAESVVRKHRLAERLLTDLIGLERHKAHIEATRWEHVISDDVEKKLVEVLGNPTTCPHGNPIPGSGYVAPKLVTLADVDEGKSFELARVTEQVEFDETWLTLLGENGLVTGAHASVKRRDGEGGVLVVCETKSVDIPSDLASLIFVKPL